MIVFENPGLIDVAAITTMGVSVKDEGAIGYFGTGLKFAIATILRDGGQVTIWRGSEKLEFGLEETSIRGQAFHLVTMNGERLGFTSQLGRDWKPWMAYRELATNCKDEGGSSFKPGHAPPSCFSAKDGHTVIMVEGLDDVWPERGSILLTTNPIADAEILEVHPGVTNHVFYRGVRIWTHPKHLAFTYNVLEPVELSEDRTAKSWYLLESSIERGIGRLEDKALLRRILTVGTMFAEHDMDIHTYGSPRPAFLEMARELTLGGAAEQKLNPHAAARSRAEAVESMSEAVQVALTDTQQRMLERAQEMLAAGGYDPREFPILVCETLGPGIHGLAKDGRIFVSRLPFEKGTREVAATLLEEYAHLKSGQGDESRGLQDWLFDRILIQIEVQAGEPF